LIIARRSEGNLFPGVGGGGHKVALEEVSFIVSAFPKNCVAIKFGYFYIVTFLNKRRNH
jgi:hypothetical protein